jgi:hypothetical protein
MKDLAVGSGSMVAKVCNDNNIKMNPITTGMVDKGFDLEVPGCIPSNH